MRRSCTDVEWFEDYRVGDEFAGEPVTHVVETKASGSRPDRGYVSFQAGVSNQSGEEVMTLAFMDIIRTRPKA